MSDPHVKEAPESLRRCHECGTPLGAGNTGGCTRAVREIAPRDGLRRYEAVGDPAWFCTAHMPPPRAR